MKSRLFLIIALLAAAPARAADPQMRAHFIDVGQGQCALLEFPCGAILIDTGGQDAEHTAALGAYLKEFFERRTDLNKTLNALIVSHPHVDHSMGVKTVFEACRIKAYIDDGLLKGSGH